MTSPKPQASPRAAQSPAVPADFDIHAALAALLAALAGRGMALPQGADPVVPRKAAAGLLGLTAVCAEVGRHPGGDRAFRRW